MSRPADSWYRGSKVCIERLGSEDDDANGSPLFCNTCVARFHHKYRIDVAQDCGICFEPLKARFITRTVCKHIFHTQCLETWRDTNRADDKKCTCPMCRQSIHGAITFDRLFLQYRRDCYEGVYKIYANLHCDRALGLSWVNVFANAIDCLGHKIDIEDLPVSTHLAVLNKLMHLFQEGVRYYLQLASAGTGEQGEYDGYQADLIGELAEAEPSVYTLDDQVHVLDS